MMVRSLPWEGEVVAWHDRGRRKLGVAGFMASDRSFAIWILAIPCGVIICFRRSIGHLAASGVV